MMDDYLYNAFFTPEVKILGYKLKPFCLGHILLLEAINSPIIKGEGDIKPSDLIVALKICASSYPFRPNLSPTFFDIWKKSRLSKDKLKFAAVASAFDKYVGLHNSKPRFWKSEDGGFGNELTSPSVLSLVVSLSEICDQEEVWSMSLGKAVWFESVLLEKRGSRRRFFYDSDIEEELPNLNDLSDDDLYELAVKDIGKARADIWFNNRNQLK